MTWSKHAHSLMRFVLIAAITCCSFALAACGSEDNASVDERFVKAVGEGLDSRWNITDKADGSEMTEEELQKGIDAEKSKVEAFKDEKFIDKELGEAAKDYIASFDDMNVSEYSSGSEQWTNAYNCRTAALYNINKIMPIKVSESHQSSLSELLENGEAASFSNTLFETVKFKKQKPKYEGDTYLEYKAVVENTSPRSYGDFWMTVSLTDSDGVVVGTEDVYTSDWSSGSKHVFSFSTDKKFKKADVTSCSWSV